MGGGRTQEQQEQQGQQEPTTRAGVAGAAAAGQRRALGACCSSVPAKTATLIAIDQTVILTAPPCFIPVETPGEGTGGCSRMRVSPGARP